MSWWSDLFGSGKENTPAAPTLSGSIQDWVNAYPQVFALQQQYAPQEAAQQIGLAQAYALPYSQTMKNVQDQLYPTESALSQKLAEQALDGINGGVPEWMRTQYKSDLNSQLGANSGSGIGADYVSRGLQGQAQDWQKYYQNLGMSITGKQPITNASPTGYSNYASQFTPNSAMSYNTSNYGNYLGGYTSMYGTNSSRKNNLMNFYGNMFGSGLGSAGTALGY